MRGTFSFCIFSTEFRFLSPFTLRNGLLKADRYSLGICQRAYSLHARTVQKEIRKDISSIWDSSSNWGVFSYPVNLRVARPRLATTRGKMPKGILLIARTVQQEIRKDICCIWDSQSFWGVFCAGICKGFSVARSCLLGYS